LKSEYREPKYAYLLNHKLESSHTKSKNLNFHLFLIEYDDPEEIPFNTIAEVSGVEPNRIRALLRSVNDPKIYLGLLDVGIESEDIPLWYARPKFIKKIVKKAKAKVVEKEVKRPAISNVMSHPLNGVTLPSTFRPYQAPEAETNYNYDAVYGERPLSPAEEAFWRARLEAMREEDLREKKHWEEIRRIEERAKRPLTLDEFKTWTDMIKLYRDVKVQGLWDEYRYWKSVVDFKAANDRAAFEKDRDEALQLAEETMGNVATAFNEMRPTRVPVKIIPLLPPNREDQYKKLRELNRQKEEEKTKGLMAIAEFTRDQRKKNRATKMFRHGSLLRPQKVYYTPGYKPEKLLDGPRGERINKLLNLDHLREIE